MTDLYLIAHKVRGQPAFDVAIQIDCPECDKASECSECDNTGYWWIIPTSGHRAYPFHAEPLNKTLSKYAEAMPASLPDHYTTRAAPTISLTEALGIRPKAPDLSRFTRRV